MLYCVAEFDGFPRRAGDVNPLIGRVIIAEIRGLTSPARRSPPHSFSRKGWSVVRFPVKKPCENTKSSMKPSKTAGSWQLSPIFPVLLLKVRTWTKPDLFPGVMPLAHESAVTQGQNVDEARSNIREVIELLLASYREHAFQHASPGVVREMVTIDGYDGTNPL